MSIRIESDLLSDQTTAWLSELVDELEGSAPKNLLESAQALRRFTDKIEKRAVSDRRLEAEGQLVALVS